MTSARDQLARSLDRIAEVDDVVHAVLALDPTAEAQADARDAESADGRGPLHGVPVLVKDNVDTAGLATTAGSLALSDVAGCRPPSVDAKLVTRLRAAGAVIVGKLNLSEWANFRDGGSTSGWSGVGGLTHNPYALNRSAGGSSSGSGAAVAAGMTPVAVGTETDGSIVCPAAYNGCVGLKPTVGSVPGTGVVPISHSQDTAGALGDTVAHAAALLSALMGTDLTGHAVDGRLAGKRIGVPRGPWWGYSAHADAAGERALELLAAAGAEVVDTLALHADLRELAEHPFDDEFQVLKAEFRHGLTAYLATREGDHPRRLEELMAFNAAHADVELAHFGQAILEDSLAAPDLDDPVYLEARERCVRVSRRDGIDGALGAHGLDALLAPTYGPAHPADLVNPERLDGSCSTPAAMAGYPLFSVPVELAGGLPVAVALWGTAGAEPTLLEIAAGLEAARDRTLGPLPAPTFAPFV